METTTSLIASSSPLFFSRPPHSLSLKPHLQAFGQKAILLSVKCSSSRQTEDAETTETKTVLSSSWSDSTYKWCTVLGGLGFLETAYLSYLKLTNSEAFCPVGGGSCGDVLNSDYSVVFGVPLPLLGMVAYGSVAVLGVLLTRKSLPFGISESSGQVILHGSTASMAAASAYFLYILSTKLSGASCPYCLSSAILSFSLFFITLKEYGLQEVPKLVGLQLSIAALVIAALSNSYSAAQPASSWAEFELPYFSTGITRQSTPYSLALAKHLRSIGAKMYGAFWCSHCLEQKQMFGSEAAKLLYYVECFPNGYKTGTKMEKACSDAKIEGFPTWVINGKVLSGEQELSDLAEASGFKFDESSPPTSDRSELPNLAEASGLKFDESN